MKLLEDALQTQRDVDTARRDYEYKAKMRLYERCEPAVFQGLEAAELARRRVVSIARSCREGDVREDGSGWLRHPGYYFQSSAFLLLAPGVTFKLLQRQLTVVDLSLDQRIHELYELFRLVFASFTDDHDLSKVEPSLPYRPDDADPGKSDRERLLRERPPMYQRQGLYIGTLERVIETLIIEREDGPRSMTFGEFVTAWADAKSAFADVKGDVLNLLIRFHPRQRPVLWRLLVEQALLYDVLLATADARTNTTPIAITEVPVDQFDWRLKDDGAPDLDITVPVEVARRTFVAPARRRSIADTR